MTTDFNKYFQHYRNRVAGLEPLDALHETHIELLALLDNIAETKGQYRYEPEKWTVKEVIGHIIDVERVFAYRAMRFARNDHTELPGFDENLYAQHSNAHNRTIATLRHEFDLLRQSSLALFNSLAEDMWLCRGTANNIDLTVTDLALLIAGHGRHHSIILQERYGV